MKPITRTFVYFDLPGALFPEEIVRPVEDRDVSRLDIPEHVYAFRFFDVTSVETSTGEVLRGAAKNPSPRYIFGKVFTLDELKREHSDKGILISNIEQKKTQKAVLCPTGNWQALLEDDIVLEPRE